MKKLILSSFSLLFVLVSIAQETKMEDPNVEKRTVKPFHAIRVSDGIDLYLTQADEDAVAISASREEYKSRLKTEVDDDGVLKIYYDRESMSDWAGTGKRLKAYVSVKSLDKLTAVAGSNVRVTGVLKSDALNMFLNSGANFNGSIETGKLVIEIESGANADVKGSVGSLHVSANTGARIEAYTLSAGKADIRSTTGARVEVTVNDEMKLYSSTGGSIYYKGNAKITELGTKFGSIIHKKDN
jgi:Putative auto-transporter adhesin, head GIN domain